MSLKLDRIDQTILTILQENGRITNAELASRVGISPPATLERVRRLERNGVIRRYVALLDPRKLGHDVMALVAVTLAVHQLSSVDPFMQRIRELPEVLECYHITGEEDFLLKVYAPDIETYEAFVLNKLSRIPGINKIKTSFVLSTVKYQTAFQLPDENPCKSGKKPGER